MKRTLLICTLLFFFLCLPAAAEQTGTEDLLDTMPQQVSDLIAQTPVSEQEFRAMTLQDYIAYGLQLVHDAIRAPLRLLAKLCVVLLLAAIARGVTDEVPAGNLTSAIDTVAALSLFTLGCTPVLALMQMLAAVLEQCKSYLAGFVPVFASVMVTCGQPAGAAMYAGIFFSSVTVLATLLCNVALPCTRVLLAFSATSAIGGSFDTAALGSSLEKALKWLLGLCATIFAALLGLQGTLAQASDNLAIKTGKFLVGSSIPVVGRAVSDALGSVVAGVKLIKGTLGFAAIAVIAAAFLPFLVECAVYNAVYIAGGLIASATGNTKASDMLSGFSRCLSLFLSMAFLFCTMVIVATMMMLLFGGGT